MKSNSKTTMQIGIITGTYTSGNTGNIAFPTGVPLVAYSNGYVIMPFQGTNGANNYLKVRKLEDLSIAANTQITMTVYYVKYA